jgi:hypothetical protein
MAADLVGHLSWLDVVVNPRSGFLGLAAEECRDVEVVRGDFVGCFADVLLNLVDYVGQRLLLGTRLLDFAAGFPCLGQERRLLWDVFLVGFLEASGDYRDFHSVLHGVVHDGAEDDVGIFMRGFLDDRRCFVDFVQS